MSDVTVILVNFNGARWLDACLASVQAQDAGPLNIILVDNASTDDSVAKVRSAFPTVQIIQCPLNEGFATGAHVGIAAAATTTVLLLNTDTRCPPELVTTLLAARRELGVDVVAANESGYDGTTHPRGTFLIDRLGYPHIRPRSPKDSRQDFYLSGACLLFAKQVWVETGGLDPRFFMYSEEVDWFWRLRLLKRSFSYAPTATVFHAGADRPAAIDVDVFRWRNRNILLMLLKNYSIAGLLRALPLLFLQSLIEAAALLVARRPDVAVTYFDAFRWNARALPETRRSRRTIQNERLVHDREIRRVMYRGSAKAAQAARLLSERPRRRRRTSQ